MFEEPLPVSTLDPRGRGLLRSRGALLCGAHLEVLLYSLQCTVAFSTHHPRVAHPGGAWRGVGTFDLCEGLCAALLLDCGALLGGPVHPLGAQDRSLSPVLSGT